MADDPLPSGPRRIVSSSHLAEGPGWESSEFEFGLIIAFHAFTRWTQRCMAAAGMPELSALEILVLHNTNSRDRDKRLSDICFLLNIEDSHTVNYALKKLLRLELLEGRKRGKEVFYRTTATGAALCQSYRRIREQCLLETLPSGEADGAELRRIAAALRALSGQYDQASRAAAAL
ncbi:winged helix DNA-binding protein [Pseudooceanicola sp. CBS1P-1]|uniref:Winged helix DNA-binding protein n=1 Tax=Pseudooceanicola albus TaxID=2692189 RepID=A0A6L7G0Z1_9RHOB|nr:MULTISPECIES: winged helix DNA-binding protein [Pseudooceanicola]MBT9382641.1 winged helix DNA-binding protein [Pseudooceanicola endophyticus]MXN17180.1 winged helix DNA-binding protein [Pseudooceanicola albus]